MRTPTRKERLRYAFDNTMSKGTGALVAWLALATVVLIAVFTVIVLLSGLSPKNDAGHHVGLFRQLYLILLHTLDPGTIGNDVGGWTFLILMLLVTLGGIFIVSALIGVIATGLDSKLGDLRKGRSFVVESGHTLILDWADSVFTILSELAIANESERRPVAVVLAEQDKVEMEDAIRQRCGDLGKTRVVCRTGSPIDLSDLAIVNPQEARSIIVLSGGSDHPDAEVIKTILALTQAPDRRPEPYTIVAEIQDATNLEAARLVGGSEAVLIDRGDTISRLLVQASRQSGLSIVYTELLDFGGDEIYFHENAALVGRTFGESLFGYETCSVIGVASAGGGVKLNPPAETVIEAGDRLVVIAEDDSVLATASASRGTVDGHAIVAEPPADDRPRRVLMLGWNSRSPSVVRELREYLAEGSTVTIAADSGDGEGALAGFVSNGLALGFRHGDTTDRRTLETLEPGTYDSVIVSCSDDADPQHADARTLMTLLHLRDIASRDGAAFTIVSEMLDDRNRQLAQVTKVDDVIVSEKLVALMIAQISENRELAPVFEDLLGAEGSEIYLKPAAQYVQTGRPVSFATILEASRRRGEVAIGYRRSAISTDAAQGFGVVVNPPKSSEVALADTDRVIVLAES
jgi:voltage-gated potassium channel Kch